MESFNVEYLSTTKNRPSLVVNGYPHRLHRKNVKFISWVCINQKRDRCNGALKTDFNYKVISMSNHACVPPDAADIELKKTIDKLKKRVREEIHSPVGRIFKEEILTACNGNASKRPLYSSLKTTLNRERRKVLRRRNYKVSSTSKLVKDRNPSESLMHVEIPNIYNTIQCLEQADPENHYQNVQVGDEKHQTQDLQKCSQTQLKCIKTENSPEHVECLVDYHPSQYPEDTEENQSQDEQIRKTLPKITHCSTELSEFLHDRNPTEYAEGTQQCSTEVIASPRQITQVKSINKTIEALKQKQCLDNSIDNYKPILGEASVDDNSPQCLVQSMEESQDMHAQENTLNIHNIKKRKLNSEGQVDESNSVIACDSTRKDEYTVFGDYVASELRKLSPRALTLAKHSINNILFEANIGSFDSPSQLVNLK